MSKRLDQVAEARRVIKVEVDPHPEPPERLTDNPEHNLRPRELRELASGAKEMDAPADTGEPQPLGLPGDGLEQTAPTGIKEAHCPSHPFTHLDEKGRCFMCERDAETHARANQLAREREAMSRGLRYHERGEARDARQQYRQGLAMVGSALATLERLGAPLEEPGAPLTGQEWDFFYRLHPEAPRPHPAA